MTQNHIHPRQPAVLATSLAKSYRDSDRRKRTNPVFAGIEFTAWPGEMVAITGPSGTGKSTLLYCLAGLEPVDAGTVVVQGIDITGCKRSTRAEVRRTTMGFVFQEYNLIDSLTARGNVELATRMTNRTLDRHRIGEVLEQVGMTSRADAYPAELSGGQQQRVAVARALATRPPVVFADEPTGALDPHNTSIVMQGLRNLTNTGTTVIIVTHDMHVADQADRTISLQPTP